MPAPAGLDAGTASQLIRGVRWAPGPQRGHERTEWMQGRHAECPAFRAGASRRRLLNGLERLWRVPRTNSAPRVRGMGAGASPILGIRSTLLVLGSEAVRKSHRTGG